MNIMKFWVLLLMVFTLQCCSKKITPYDTYDPDVWIGKPWALDRNQSSGGMKVYYRIAKEEQPKRGRSELTFSSGELVEEISSGPSDRLITKPYRWRIIRDKLYFFSQQDGQLVREFDIVEHSEDRLVLRIR
jgi:hypothetical protein